MIRTCRDEEEKNNLRNMLARLHERMLVYEPIHSTNAHLILRPLKKKSEDCKSHRSIVLDHHHIIDFSLCVLFIFKIYPHLEKTSKVQLQSKGKGSGRSILELSQPFENWFKDFDFEDWFKDFDESDQWKNEGCMSTFLNIYQLKEQIDSSRDIAVHHLFRKEPQSISSVVSRLGNFLSYLTYEPSHHVQYYFETYMFALRYEEIFVLKILEVKDEIMARTNRIQNDVAKLKKHNAAARKKPRPTLNFHMKDDTIYYYDQRMENELQLDRQEQMDTIDQKAYDESETSAEGGDTNHTEDYHQETQVGPESYASEDYATFDSRVIGNITEGFTHVHTFSLEDDEEENASASECESESEYEWEIVSRVESVKSYGENEDMFTYKDALLHVQMQTNRNSASTILFPNVNAYYKTSPFQSPPLARTFPTTTSTVLVEKEDEDNTEFDAYFEYEAYKGGGGRNWMLKQKRHARRNPNGRRDKREMPKWA